ncbi:hypothetical protein HBB16_15235 [Pseudonocardia sp. MCCB 268]|nr:hypothetical protein [Pseudonocardia cytotoxica]
MSEITSPCSVTFVAPSTTPNGLANGDPAARIAAAATRTRRDRGTAAGGPAPGSRHVAELALRPVDLHWGGHDPGARLFESEVRA